MRPVLRGVALAAPFIVIAAGLVASCAGDAPWLGGYCAADADCHTGYQDIPGAVCTGSRCVCVDSDSRICCLPSESSDPDCPVACRPCSECAPGTEECMPDGGVDAGCRNDAECPGPPSPACGAGRCVEGACDVEIRFGPIASQRQGDCRRMECTTAGELVEVEDPSDVYDDGEPCTYDSCGEGRPVNTPLTEGAVCPGEPQGMCHVGACVACYAGDVTMNDCLNGLACDGVLCVPPHCTNNAVDPALGETARDCGGLCRPCADGEACVRGADCENKVCEGGRCASPACDDGAQNGNETGIDCGALPCPRCPAGQGCRTGAECDSGVCWAGICREPSCTDGVMNQGENGVDCGGSCAPCR
ncbi:hypothetical protein WME76_30245 [Sorangium sp. So ce119]|uniref:hypothetical protein n=1 Tax=Sorangium sp. So ce119 TaxID=3133279 RepID=UPI003F5DA7C9